MLNSGARIGGYEIVGSLGAGGMGEVYRARDVKLGRDIALKILPDAVRSDPERVGRFEREARVLAGLNHTHIAGIYGFVESDGIDAIAMELVEGPTLADRLATGPLPIDEALAVAAQIAEALEAAHEKGIVHRDLKPANVKVRADGVVKVLDFGLAKALDPVDAAQSSPTGGVSVSPTLTARTRHGVILGTAAYMSPEQARGKTVDKRTDIWAYGCALYEMLTGRRAFDADEITDTIALVVMKEPDWSRLPAETPSPIRRLLRRCLEKDRKRRLADIADAGFEIQEALRPAAARTQLQTPVRADASSWRSVLRLSWIVAALAIVSSATMLVLWSPWRTAAPRSAIRLSADFGADVVLASNGGPALAISPDGATLAFVGQPSTGEPQLYVRRLDQLKATVVERSEAAVAPFFSPDGQWIAYFAGGKLRKVPVNGGASIALVDSAAPRGGAWAENGTIVFAPTSTGPLLRVAASGGQPESVTALAVAEGEATIGRSG